jgi:hypothetical protein
MSKLIKSQRMKLGLAAVSGGLAVVLLGAGAITLAGAASAGTASPAPSSSSSGGAGSGGTSTTPPKAPREGGPWRPWVGLDFGRVLHGTGVVKKSDGTFQTVAMQRGKVTAVSATSITVKSDDGYSATYVVNSATKVNGKNGKITDIKVNAGVLVEADVNGSTSTATRIIDRAFAMNWFGHHTRPGGANGANGNGTTPSAPPSPSTTG